MKLRTILMFALVPLALTACSDQGPAKRAAVAPAAKVVGDPKCCVRLAEIRETRIRDDWTIDFIGGGDRVWRNTLTARCPGLRAANAITYKTSLSQLCSTDIVYVLETTGGVHRGPACGLGQFVPVKLEKKK
jgi:hypothetical protein